MAGGGKLRDVYLLHINYGWGWEVVETAYTPEDILRLKQEYAEKTGVPLKLTKRKVLDNREESL